MTKYIYGNNGASMRRGSDEEVLLEGEVEFDELASEEQLEEAFPNYSETKNEDIAKKVRAQRDRKLSETDWYVTRSTESGGSVPANVVTFRQALRDIPEQPGFPSEIIWPVLQS